MADTTQGDETIGGASRLDPFLDRILGIALAAPGTLTSDVVSWHGHIPFAQILVAIDRPRLVVELGVHKGDSYRAFVDAMARYGIEGRAFGIDSWQGDAQAGNYDGDAIYQEVAERNIEHAGFSTLLRQTFDEACEGFADGSIDLLHIDGLHTYEAVRHDFESWRSKLSPRAVVLFHDTAVREGDFGVCRLWEELRSEHLSYEFTHSHGLGVLCVGDTPEPGTRRLIELLSEAPRDGVAPAALLRSVGEAFAGRIGIGVFRDLYLAKEEEARSTQRASMAEIERLNDEIRAIRLEQQAAADEQREAKSAEDVARREGDLSALVAKELARHKAELPLLIADELERRQTLRHRIRCLSLSARLAAQRAARVGGRSLIDALPMPEAAKTRLKYRLIFRLGQLAGMAPPRRNLDTSNSAQVELQVVSGRYLDLARMATGAPAEAPGRGVSIVIPVHDQIDYTRRCLDSIRRNTTDVEHEVIVVDDGSTDLTADELSQREDVIYLRNDINLGFIGSCNAGLARASKDYVLFLNNDTEVGPGWLSTLLDTFELHENVGLVGSKLIYPDGRLQEAGGIIWNDFSGWNWGRMQDPNEPRFNYVRQADYCSGASIMLPRALATALGGFDPEFAPAYGEDSDLAFKVRSLGLSVLYQPLSQVIHHEGISSGTDPTRGVKAYQAANARKLAERWAPVLPYQAAPGSDPDLAADSGHVGRVLVIDQITPEPDRDAGSITALEAMRALRDLGYKVTFVPCSNLSYIPDYSDMLGALGIESVHYPWNTSVADHLKRFGQHYDAVLIFRFNSALAHLDEVRRHAPKAKVIYHASDLHFLREERAAKVGNDNIPERRNSAEKTMRTELDIIARCDLTITHSQYEKELLAGIAPGAAVAVFPWIYDPRGPGNPPGERRDLVFLGGYRHYPNVDAAMFFASDILPLLLPRHPDLVFQAVGSSPPPELDALEGPNFRVTGFVEDLSPILWGARVMVAPLRYGAGLKGKIVTALAHGLPVVTTTIGAEGMGLTDGVDVMVADTPEEIAAAVERLYSDDALWTALSRAGLDYVVRTTSSEVGYATVATILETVGLGTNLRLIAPEAPRSAFGSPAVLFDPARLLAAAAGPGDEGLLIVPPGLADVEFSGWHACTAAEVGAPATNVVAIVDGTSDAAVAELTGALAGIVAPGGIARIIFAPARLALRESRYAILRPFDPEPVGEATVGPPHLRHRNALESIGGTLSWRVDTRLRGFPTLIIADWTPDGA